MLDLSLPNMFWVLQTLPPNFFIGEFRNLRRFQFPVFLSMPFLDQIWSSSCEICFSFDYSLSCTIWTSRSCTSAVYCCLPFPPTSTALPSNLLIGVWCDVLWSQLTIFLPIPLYSQFRIAYCQIICIAYFHGFLLNFSCI